MPLKDRSGGGVTDGDKGDVTVAGGAWSVDSGVVTESKLNFSDNTTADVSILKHGLTPKLPNDTAKFLRGDGLWEAPAGGSSKLVQRVRLTLTADYSTTAVIPWDGTRPQNTEGTQLATLSITPTSTSNFLRVTAFFPLVGTSFNVFGAIALFKDSEAGAKQACLCFNESSYYSFPAVLDHIEQVTSTSEQTWKIRYGVNSGTVYLNRAHFYSNVFGGGVPYITFVIEEYTP